ncbi:hypothetical protein BYT27DRAFT_7197390 [Phlegmacium glaucopus]|nr:hypothetical protein BYT27DRAFT_7197390 [Phlegmacium glaucopus]
MPKYNALHWQRNLTGTSQATSILDNLMGINQDKSLLQRRRLDSVRSELNALPPQHPDNGT